VCIFALIAAILLVLVVAVLVETSISQVPPLSGRFTNLPGMAFMLASLTFRKRLG
jgi:hypothetical protein